MCVCVCVRMCAGLCESLRECASVQPHNREEERKIVLKNCKKYCFAFCSFQFFLPIQNPKKYFSHPKSAKTTFPTVLQFHYFRLKRISWHQSDGQHCFEPKKGFGNKFMIGDDFRVFGRYENRISIGFLRKEKTVK